MPVPNDLHCMSKTAVITLKIHVVGVVLGLFGGGLTNFLLHLSGMTMEEARYWQQHWRDRREQVVYAKAIEKREKEEFELLHEHSLKYKDNKELIIDNEDENKTENKS